MRKILIFILILIAVCCADLPYPVALAQQPVDGLLINDTLDHIEQVIDQRQEAVSMEPAAETVESLAKEEAPATPLLETKVIPILHAEASGIIAELNAMKSSRGEVTFNTEDRTLTLKDEPGPLSAMSDYVKRVDILLETEAFELKFIKAKDIIQDVRAKLTADVGQVDVDVEDNSIVVTDTPGKIGLIRDLIANTDVLLKEIRIEAKVLEVVLNDEHVGGVDWEAIVSEYRNTAFPGFSSYVPPEGESKLALGAISREDYAILQEALDTVGIIHTVSEQTLTLDNEATGLIKVSPSLYTNGSGIHDQSYEEEVRFHVTSTIGKNEFLNVKVRPELAAFDSPTEPVPPGGDVTIEMEDGSVMVIGSLFKEVMVESSWKIPLLGDIPLLGTVFRNQGEVPRKAEVITFLTVKTVEKKR